MKKFRIIVVIGIMLICNACTDPCIKIYRKFERASPEQLIQALNILFEQYPEHRVPCKAIELTKSICNNLLTCEEKQRCYYQTEIERYRRGRIIKDSILIKEGHKLKIKPIGMRHAFSFSNSPDTVIGIVIGNSINYDNKYADIGFAGFHDIKTQTYYNGTLSHSQRKQVVARFETDILPKIRRIIKEIRKK